MSYCVNCGVELDASAEECPLCNTPVLNPRELEKIMKDRTAPFPRERGQVETVKRKDVGILTTVILLTTALTCGLLNKLVFHAFPWSIPVIGVCVGLWVFLIPLVINVKQTIYVSVFFDGVAVGAYLYMLTYLTKSNTWFLGLAIPIVALITLATELLIFIYRKVPKSYLGTAIMFVSYVAVVCVGTEIIIDWFAGDISLSWSAVVLTVCAIIDITLITIVSHKRLRNAVRRRLHF